MGYALLTTGNLKQNIREQRDCVVCGPPACCAWSQTLDDQINEPTPVFSLRIVLFLFFFLLFK